MNSNSSFIEDQVIVMQPRLNPRWNAQVENLQVMIVLHLLELQQSG